MHTTFRSRGFTLIELLTVIAIIAVLAAILFPVAGTVREQSRASSCMTNLHQIWVAANVYKQDEGAYPGALLGYREVDAQGNVIPVDRTSFGQLYKEIVKDVNVFRCPDNNNPPKNQVVPGYIPPKPPQWPTSITRGSKTQAVTWIGDVLASMGCSDNNGPYDCWREADGVMPASPLYHQPKLFYVWDSYDIGPALDPQTGQAISGVYYRHYSPDWTGEYAAAMAAPGSIDTSLDLTNQLEYQNPPDDRTLLTYCTYHAATAHANTATIISMSGSAKKVALDRLFTYGPDVFSH